VNKIQKAVSDFEKKNGVLLKKVSDALISTISENDSVSVISDKITKIYTKYNVKKETKNLLLNYIVESVSIGIGTEIAGKKRVNSFKYWYAEHAYNAAGVPIKTTLNSITDILAVKKEITRSLAAGSSWRKAAQDLSDKKIIISDVAKDVQSIIDKARGVFGLTNSSEAYQEYKKEISIVQHRINRLTDQDTSKLKRAYQDILDITNKSSAAQVENAIKYASYFKERYNTERIARTEMARAYGDAAFSDAIYTDDIVGIQFNLSDRHVEFDICNFHCEADLYGMGAGIYPKERAPEYPFHPNCVLPGNRIYFRGNIVAASKSFYRGDVVEITTVSGKRSTVTGNHPILTNRGWIAAHKLTKTDKILSSKISNRPCFTMSPDDNERQPLIEDIFTTFNESIGVSSTGMEATPEDFHGDGKFLNGKINIVSSKRKLGYTFNSLLFEIFYNKIFRSRIMDNIFGVIKSNLRPMFFCLFFASNRIMSFFSNALIIFRSSMKRVKQGNPFFHRTPFNISFYQEFFDSISTSPSSVRNALFGLSPDIALDYIADIKTFAYSGHVYDLQIGDDTIYISNGVVVKNCLCNISTIYNGEVPDKSGSDYDPKQGKKYLEKLSDQDRKDLMGIKGAEAFADSPKTWEKNLRNWNGQENKEATIPESVLYGEK